MDIRERIRDFILSNFLIPELKVPLDDDTPLLESGILDSTGVMELVLFVGEEFGIEVPAEDLLPENFDSINVLANYIQAHAQS